MTDYERDSDDDINDDNEEANYSDNNDGDSMQYVIAAHLSNKFFMLFLIAKKFFLSSEPNEAQYFVLNHYTEIVF